MGKYIKQLEEINKAFERRKLEITTPKDFISILKDFQFDFEDYKEGLLYPENLPYGRNILFSSGNFEAILMNWLPGKCSYIHDHGSSFGVVYVFTNGGNNVSYNSDYNYVSTIPLLAGNMVEVPRGYFHKIENPTNFYSVTLHFYAPPLIGMKIIDEKDTRRQFIVTSGTGAWEPIESEIEKRL
jgi:cysteine dioxygenase